MAHNALAFRLKKRNGKNSDIYSILKIALRSLIMDFSAIRNVKYKNFHFMVWYSQKQNIVQYSSI